MDRGVCVWDDSSSSRQHEHHLLREALPDFSASTETREAPPPGRLVSTTLGTQRVPTVRSSCAMFIGPCVYSRGPSIPSGRGLSMHVLCPVPSTGLT